MVEISPFSFNNATPITDNNKYKKCSISNCENDGDYLLSCSSINKIGLFCKRCRIELEDNGIVDYTSSDYSVKEEAVNRK